MNFIEERIKKTLDYLETRVYKEKVKLTNLKYTECDYKGKENKPDADAVWCDYETISIKNSKIVGSSNTKKDTHFWVKGKIILPDSYIGKNVDITSEFDGVGVTHAKPQIMIYLNDEMVGAFDRTHFEFRIDSTVKEYDIMFYVYLEEGINPLRTDFYLSLLDDEVFALYFDLMVPYDVLDATVDTLTREYEYQKHIINNAINILDLSLDYDAFIESVKKCREYLKVNYYDYYANKNNTTVSAIGHTHIDVAWLWTYAQTREKTQRSFANFVSLMNRYPDFKLMQSTPQIYDFIKEDMPTLYKKVKEKVSNGQWQPEGSMWVEADCNLTSGESLVRQVLYGKRFFKEEFGIDNRILWLPDVFGYSANLPQILKKSGVDYFVTSKISWNETNKVPYDIFNWVGIDGSKVFSYFLTAQNSRKAGGTYNMVTYNGNTSAQMVEGTYRRFQQKDLSDEVMLTYGDGDGGGGPNVRKIEMALRMTNGIGSHPKVVFDQPLPFLDRVYEKVKDEKHLPEWNGELYLEYHRGTYTSQAKNKKYNRMCEFMYQNIETLSLISKELFSTKYPREYLYKSWKDIMICQFHDVLPGSSIREVYDDSDYIYSQLEKNGKSYLNKYRNLVKKNIKTNGGILAFNPNSFASSTTVCVDGEYLYLKDIPSKGFAVLKPSKTVTPKVDKKKRILENKYTRVQFDENFNITSIYDFENDCELIIPNEKANKLVVYEDYPRNYDNWELSEYYIEKSHDIDNVTSVKEIVNGEIGGFEIVRKFYDITIVQKIYLYGHENKITFKTDVDFNMHHLVLKSLFPIDVNTNKARFDIQYGNVERYTHKNTSWDEAKFEVCMHKYADISQYDHGVTFTNDCKYGCSVDNTTFAITLIKSGTFPDPNADQGKHSFTYELCPHKGDMFSYGNIKKAYELNNPVVCYRVEKQDGCISDKYSLVSLNNENIFIETIKMCEDDDSIIVRLNEQFGANSNGKLVLGFKAKKAYVCDLLENNIEQIKLENENTIPFSIKPYEILTIKIMK